MAKVERAMVSFGAGYKSNVFDKYNKSMGIEKSVAAKAPTFHDIANEYSKDAIAFWLRFHIAETFSFIGIYDQASKFQIRQTAELILQHEIFGQLTLQEFLCFLTRFKRGDYGKIYNSNRPNPQEFLQCLQPFWNELSYWRGRQAEKDRVERLSAERLNPENITWEQWKAEKEMRHEEIINKTNILKK